MCDAAVVCTTGFLKSLTLDIVKCTGFYCFAVFCFHRSFNKVLFHSAAFPPFVYFLVLDVGWESVHPLIAVVWSSYP